MGNTDSAQAGSSTGLNRQQALNDNYGNSYKGQPVTSPRVVYGRQDSGQRDKFNVFELATCGDIVGPHQYTTAIASNASVSSAIAAMNGTRGHTLLVKHDGAVEEDDDDSPEVFGDTFREYIGTIGVQDILAFLSFHATSSPKTINNALDKTPVQDLIGLYYSFMPDIPSHNGLFLVKPDASFFKMIGCQGFGANSVFVRYPGVDTPVKELSQRVSLEFIQRVAQMSPTGKTIDVLSSSVEESGLLTKKHKFNPLTSVSPRTKLGAAMQTLIHSRADALALVNGAGKLLSTVSPYDILALVEFYGPKLHTALDKSLKEVMSDITGSNYMPSPVTVTAKDSVSTVLDKMISHKIHRVWAVDDGIKPMSCVTVEDLLTVFGPYAGAYKS